MSLKQDLMTDMKQAMKDKDSLKLGAIRYLMAEIKKYEIDNGEQDEAGLIKLITKQVKQMKDAISDFASGGRQDLVDEEEAKVAVLEAYLPAQLGDEELEKLVANALASLTDKPNMGQAMKTAMAAVGGRADGRRVSAVVQKLLNS